MARQASHHGRGGVLYGGGAPPFTRKEHRRIKSIDIITVVVSDQDRGAAFYRDVLDFDVQDDTGTVPGFRWLTAAPQGWPTRIVLHAATPEMGRSPGGWTGLVLGTDDIQATYRDLKSKGVNFTAELRTEPWGMEAQFADPDGNTFELVQQRPA